MINLFLSGCKNISLNVYVSFWSWLDSNTMWLKWLSVLSRWWLISWMCLFSLIRNIYGRLIISQVPIRAKDKISTSTNIFDCSFAFYDILCDCWSLVDTGSIFLGIQDLVADLDMVSHLLTSTGLGVKCKFSLDQNPSFTELFCMSGSGWSASFREICTFGADYCYIFAQLFVCYLQGGIVVLEDCYK